jgi:hypothetical protein
MRSRTWTRWAICALAITVCVPVVASARGGKSVAHCTSFDQQDKGDDAVQFTIASTCSMPLKCSISWRVVCAPGVKKRRAVHPTARTFTLDKSSDTSEASAAVCGDDAWSIEGVQWNCEPDND